MRRGCDRHEPLSLEPDLHPFADSYPKQPKHTIVLKSGTVYTPRGTTRSAQTERMKKHAQEDTGARAGSQKAAERAAAKDGVSLAGEARDMETGKDALAGDDPAKSTKSRTGQDIAQ